MITETVTYNPIARLYLQGDLSYVLSRTNTAVDGIVLNGSTATAAYTTPTFNDFTNNYWTISGAVGYVLDDKTDLRADYTYYRAGDYYKNPQVALPYGMTSSESTVSATASREISKNMRLTFKYTYFTYEDKTSGNRNNFEAHSFYSGLQFRF
jgi:predicted porin